MIFKLFARKSASDTVERLYGQIMAAARRPELFLGRYAVADTVDGRFDLVALHAFLALRRLSALEAPGPQMAQELTDRIFLGFDRALREMGVGDLSVPKRMKKLAGDYTGRIGAYEAGLADGEDALAAALARNVYGSASPQVAAALAAYTRAAAAAFAQTPLSAFEQGVLPFPDPAAF